MPSFEGTWKMRSSDNFEELLKALGEDDIDLFVLSLSRFQRRFNCRLSRRFVDGLLFLGKGRGTDVNVRVPKTQTAVEASQMVIRSH